MNIEKRGTSYRIREMVNGKRVSLTVPFKPTSREAFELIQNKINHSAKISMSFDDASKQYIKVKSNVLSPSTIRGYNTILRNMPDDFKAYDINDINDFAVQKLINDYSENHEPKSVRNLHGFVSAVIRLFIPSATFHTTLPQNKRKTKYTPSYNDVRRLMESAKNTEYYIALFLASMSLRRSEICALTVDDLKGNTLTINKALVPSDNGFVVKSTPKTDASYRTIVLPDEIADKIREQGYVFRNSPQSIDQYIRRTLPKLGIEHFSVHYLRHFFASYAHDLGYSDAQIQKMGGWSSSSDVMKRVYRHALDEEESKKSVANDFKAFI